MERGNNTMTLIEGIQKEFYESKLIEEASNSILNEWFEKQKSKFSNGEITGSYKDFETLYAVYADNGKKRLTKYAAAPKEKAEANKREAANENPFDRYVIKPIDPEKELGGHYGHDVHANMAARKKATNADGSNPDWFLAESKI